MRSAAETASASPVSSGSDTDSTASFYFTVSGHLVDLP
jgi:hypothetical protein